jgi:predicted metal-dependent hydrolase
MSAFEYQLARSTRRKTLSIIIRRGKVKVMAPIFLSEQVITEFVTEKSSWVLQKLRIQQSWTQQAQVAKKQFVEGESFLFLGNRYSLKICPASKSAIELINNDIFVSLSNRVKPANKAVFIEKLLQDWYKQQIDDYLTDRIAHYARLMAVTPSSINIRFYKSRWGSCSAKGRLSFNYLLMMAPDWVIDYVIVHELSHLRHLNHSAHFWAVVSRHYPGYQSAADWLKVNGKLLVLS